jgi:dipeptidyl aminopeptidase/acylaminoacyl peptidase
MIPRSIRVLALLSALAAPAASQKPVLTPADYARWESLGASELAPDGRTFAFTITRVDGDDDLRVHFIAADSTHVVANGLRPVFSRDGRWLAYAVGVSRAEQKRLDDSNQPSRTKLGLIELRTGARFTIDGIADYEFSADSRFIVMRAYNPPNSTRSAFDIIVRDLASGVHTTFANVSAYAWREHGAALAIINDVTNRAGNGVRVYDAASGVTRTLDADTATYTGLQWRADADDLAVLRIVNNTAYEEQGHAILAWRGAGSPAPRRFVLDAAARTDVPAHHRIVEFRDVEWSADGSYISLGLRPWAKKPAADSMPAKQEQPANVEVWHTRDVDIIPEQKVRAGIERNRSLIAVWHLVQDRVVRLSQELGEDVTLSDGGYALTVDNAPYGADRMFGPALRDLYVVDITNGARTKAAERVQYQYGISPGGKYVVYVRDGHYWSFDSRTHRTVNITRDAPTSFINLQNDLTVAEKPPFGTGGWTPHDRGVIVHDRYDVWDVALDGSRAVRLTDGGADRVVHRRVWLDVDQRIVDTAKPVYVTLYGERTKKYGYGVTRAGGSVERLVYTDKLVSRLGRATDAEIYTYRVEAFDDSPDVFVGSARLADARQVTRTNPFMGEYAWGQARLLDFVSARGDSLQSALLYPANYEPGRTYPLVVFPYEITSNTLHTFYLPTETNPYNPTVLTQQGYFVLRPDIVYRARNPGLSAQDAIVPAVEQAIGTGLIDRARIGILGHSWGAYQATFLVTQTDLFRTAVAGAPLTNLISMYGSVYWNAGTPDAKIFETGQARMEVPFWEDVETYIRNSPLFSVQRMNAPLLVAFGDEDGAVDWNQGVELYNAARRLGKQMVMLVYPGENHSLSRKPNQIDLHRRIMQWFNHYLQGAPAPAWITEGVPHR